MYALTVASTVHDEDVKDDNDVTSLLQRATQGIAALAAAALITGCSVTITSQPDPTIEDDTLLIAGDSGSPNYERNFNPYLPSARSARLYIYEPLVMVNALDGTIDPWLATDWDQPDPATIVMTIDDDAVWQDGEALTTDDVVFTFEMLREFPAVDLYGAWSRIDSIESDESTVTFHLQTDDAPAISAIGKTLIVPEHIWADVEDPATFRNEEPVGSGPYELGNFTPLQYSLDAFDGHRLNEQIEVRHIVFPAASKEVDLVTRGFDWGYSYITDVDNTWGAANPNNAYWFPPGGIIGLHANLEKAPFDDADVRRGLALALDKARIAEVAVEGHMAPASQTGLLLPNQDELLNPDIPNEGVIEQDQDAAVEAFEAAGFSFDGSVMRDASGAPFSFTLMTANGYTDALRASQEVQRQLADIGIEVDIDTPQAAAKEAAMVSGDFEVAIGSSGGGDAYTGYNNLLSGEFYAPTGENSQNNRIRFQDDEVDTLLRAYRSAVDDDEQREILGQIEQIMYDELPVVSLYYGALWGLYNDGRFTGWPTEDDPYAPLMTWESSVLQIVTTLQQVEDGDDS